MSEHKNIKQIIGETYRSVYSYLKPVSNVSSFFEKGILTPQEFVDAGDYLVHKFKTWKWQKAHDKRSVTYLPHEKQFLLMRNVPCRQRVRELNHLISDSKIVENEWVYPDYKEDNTEIDLTQSTKNKSCSSNQFPKEDNTYEENDCDINNDDDEVIDFYNYDIDETIFKENDPAAANHCKTSTQSEELEREETMRIRTYDISITYDKYYQTPRIWLFGYNEHGVPLKPEDVFEDTVVDYNNHTVTPDIHPCTGIMSVSIHPCKQADVMQKVVKIWVNDNLPPRHDLSILILLKSISTIIPTVEYDFTMDIEMAMYFKN